MLVTMGRRWQRSTEGGGEESGKEVGVRGGELSLNLREIREKTKASDDGEEHDGRD